MDAALFAKILSDKSTVDLKKLRYKYPGVDVNELIGLLKLSMYKPFPILDFDGSTRIEAVADASFTAKAAADPSNERIIIG